VSGGGASAEGPAGARRSAGHGAGHGASTGETDGAGTGETDGAGTGETDGAGHASPSGAVRLTRRAVERPWGGEHVAPSMGWPRSGKVGEWWLASCYVSDKADPALSVSGVWAGGDDAESREHEADSDDGDSGLPPIDELFSHWLDGPDAPRGSDGARLLPSGDDFPLLLKLLDTSAVLSVQVHPDDTVASTQNLPNGKTEAWHVLAAEPTACLFVGTADDVSDSDLLDAVQAGVSPNQMTQLLRRVPAVPGETWLVEAGTIHAVGPGVTIFEIQQSSDATWRIYDWERQPARELHLDAARAAARDLPAAHPAPPPGDRPGWHLAVRCEAFALQHGRVAGELALPSEPSWGLVTALSGQGTLRTDAGELALSPGETLLSWGGGTLVGDGLTLLYSVAG